MVEKIIEKISEPKVDIFSGKKKWYVNIWYKGRKTPDTKVLGLARQDYNILRGY